MTELQEILFETRELRATVQELKKEVQSLRPDRKQYYNAKEAAKYIGSSESTVRNLLSDGLIKGKQPTEARGSTWRIPIAELERYLEGGPKKRAK